MGPYSEIAHRLRRATRKNAGFALNSEQAAALLSSPIYTILCELEGAEMRAATLWAVGPSMPAAEPRHPAGPLSPEQRETVEAVERCRASDAVSRKRARQIFGER